MASALKVYIGWDPRDMIAYEVCRASLERHSSVPLEIEPLIDWRLRNQGVLWRPHHIDERGQAWDDRDGKPFSTQFSFSRFAVPLLEEYRDEWVLFCDPDMLWLADVSGLLDRISNDYGLMCVQHEYTPSEREKMGGLIQTTYRRKNWSSLMLINPSRCRELTKYAVNNMSGSWLHGMCWIDDSLIGRLPEEWNWLEGWSSPDIKPKVAHFTRGTPDLPGSEDATYSDRWWKEFDRSKTMRGLPEYRRVKARRDMLMFA